VRPHVPRLAVASALVLGTAAGAFVVQGRAGAATASRQIATASRVIIDPKAWAGQPFPLAEYIDVGPELKTSRWIAVFYHRSCPKCLEALPQYELMAQDLAGKPGAPRIALIEMPPYASPDTQAPAVRSNCLVGKLDDSKKWIAETPLTITLADGIIQ
jgi:hypothetical protein